MPLRPLLIAGALAAAAAAQAATAEPPPQLAKYDCLLCHEVDQPRTGPGFVEIAEQYRDDHDAAAKLLAVLKKGAHGTGPWHMPPAPQVADADARRIVAWILALKPAAPAAPK